MDFDFADILDRGRSSVGASDLHLTVGAPPMVRVRGQLQRARGYPTLDARRTRARSSTRSSPTTSASGSRTTGSSTSPTRSPATARFRVNAYFQRAAVGAAFRLIPTEIKPLEHARPAAASSRTSPRSRAASCSSPARPARASRPRSPR